MLIDNTGFLCGYFSAPKAAQGFDANWTRTTCSADERAMLNNYYFPEFAQCMTDEVTLYTRDINKECVLAFEDEKVPFRIVDIRFWEAPFHICLYAIQVQFRQLEFNSVTRALNALRNCAYYQTMHAPFIEAALAPVIAVCNATTGTAHTADGSLAWMVESGNKFKLFQILQVPEGIEKGDEQLLLYDAGTLARHTPLSTGINSPAYIEQVLADHRISVFSGWSGLALLDTFTLLSENTPEWVMKNWQKDYFEKVYIYQLFRKVFLYSVNLHYRRRSEEVTELEKRLDQFEQQYSYSAISYNFLPNIISEAIEKSLHTQRDYDQLDRMINKEIEMRRNQAEEKTNHFLTFLTCLTIFSAIYDFASLINESFGYETYFPNDHVGFRLVGTTLLLVILVVYLVLNRKK